MIVFKIKDLNNSVNPPVKTNLSASNIEKMSKACLKKGKKSATLSELSHVMRKPVYAIFEQQRRRSACASAQSARSLISTFVVGCLDTIIPEPLLATSIIQDPS